MGAWITYNSLSIINVVRYLGNALSRQIRGQLIGTRSCVEVIYTRSLRFSRDLAMHLGHLGKIYSTFSPGSILDIIEIIAKLADKRMRHPTVVRLGAYQGGSVLHYMLDRAH